MGMGQWDRQKKQCWESCMWETPYVKLNNDEEHTNMYTEREAHTHMIDAMQKHTWISKMIPRYVSYVSFIHLFYKC